MRVEANRLRKERREAQKEQARQKQKMPKHPKCMSCSSVAAKLCVHTLCAQCCRRQFIEVLKSEGTIDDDTDTAVSVTPCTETNTKVVLKYVDESGCNARVRIQRDVIAKVFCAVHSCHDWARWLGTPRPSSRKKARMQSSDLVVEGESAAVKDEQPKTEEEAQR